MAYYFSSESVSEGHPDKIADQISDALLDEFLRWDPESKVACETLVTTGLVVCSGEVKTEAYIDIQDVVRGTLKSIGYTKAEYRFDADSCGIISTIHEQSQDIRQGVVRRKPEEQGAGDQGMMFGYANDEMDNLAPLPIEIAHRLVQDLAKIRKEGKVMKYLRPDSKSQVTILYNDKGKAERIETIVISTQHDDEVVPKKKTTEKQTQEIIKQDIIKHLIPRVKKNLKPEQRKLFTDSTRLLVNPTGKFVIGGPHGDTGLTGRKIIVDTYGGRGAHGGGAFSGKDASKVDRSAAYAMRHLAKNLVAAGVAGEVLVQVAYAIGVAEPLGIYVNTFGSAKVKNKKGQLITDGEIAEKVLKIFDLRPFKIVEKFGLKNPIFLPTATYGHFGRDCEKKPVTFYYPVKGGKAAKKDGRNVWIKEVEFFTWEKTDMVPAVKKEFGL